MVYNSPSFCIHVACSSLPIRAHRPRGLARGPLKHGTEADMGIDTGTGAEKLNSPEDISRGLEEWG